MEKSEGKPTTVRVPEKLPVSEKKYRMLVYLGTGRADSKAPFEHAGCRFERGVVTPVTDDVFVFFKIVHNFREIVGISNTVVDFPRKNQ